MSVFKCKMCGGSLEIAEGIKICECEYCGTMQTVPSQQDENLQALFNRANILRMKSEFDKAEQIYEKIIQNAPDEPEAHWGLILCKYGIEYVEDPATFKRIPTCHRTSFDSIISDEDYKEALRCADPVQRAIYEREAKEIDRLQKEILALSAKEEPYDVFICYKESDNGSRTPDSVIGNEIYHQLTNEGFKVFYAAISLEDKLGSAYEPCIFAALNSAKVMLAIGTKPEYFNAVWVRNEWGRYLKIMKTDRSKLLIPCYKDMDAYELPEEFAHLQAQDMGKIGFINDIVRGIKKVVDKKAVKTSAVSKQIPDSAAATAGVASLMKRVFIFLEDGDFKSADEYCEKVLDLDPENGEAYLGKLMAELHVKKRDDLKHQPKSFDQSANYQKIMRFGGDGLKAEMQECITYINEQNRQTYLQNTYNKAKRLFDSRNVVQDGLKRAKSIFLQLGEYKDAKSYISRCDERIRALDRKDSYKVICHALNDAKTQYEAVQHPEKCDAIIKEAEKLASQFDEYTDFSDMPQKKQECEQLIEQCRQAKPQLEERIALEQRARAVKAAKARKRKIVVAVICVLVVGIILGSLLVFVIIPTVQYNNAKSLFDNGEYEEAIPIFEKLNGYSDANELLLQAKHEQAKSLISSGKYEEAIAILEKLNGNSNTNELLLQAKHEQAESLISSGKYEEAIAILEKLNGYGASNELIMCTPIYLLPFERKAS